MSKAVDPINDVAVPEMIIKLRQGVGRLIRTSSDKRIVSILDPRLSERCDPKYKQTVLDSLNVKNKISNIEELQRFWDNLNGGTV